MSAGIRVEVRATGGFGHHSAILRRAGRLSLRLLEAGDCELSISLVDDGEMQELNATWRGRDQPTDVLAFAQGEGEGGAPSGLLGDVVLCVPTATKQAVARGHTVDRELVELLIHGILHLMGYDHEGSEAEAQRMLTRQHELVLAVEDATKP